MGNVFRRPASYSVIVIFSVLVPTCVLFPNSAFPSAHQGCLSARSFFSSHYMNFVEVSPGKYTPAFLGGDENRLKVFYIQQGEGASVEVWKHGSVFKFKFKEVFLPEPDQVYMGHESKENMQQIFMTDGDAIQLNFVLEDAEGEQNQKLTDIEIFKSSNTCK